MMSPESQYQFCHQTKPHPQLGGGVAGGDPEDLYQVGNGSLLGPIFGHLNN